MLVVALWIALFFSWLVLLVTEMRAKNRIEKLEAELDWLRSQFAQVHGRFRL